MMEVRTCPLGAAVQELHRTLDANCRAQESQWAGDVHSALGQLASAIQDEVQAVEKSMKMVGDINPDFQNAPVAERHTQTRRDQLIQLGEQVHRLRADIRTESEWLVIDVAQICKRADVIHDALEQVRLEDDDFLQTTLNTNLGAGE
jgi:hypothetical protein